MRFYNKTTLLPNLDALYLLLVKGPIINPMCLFCIGRRIAIEHNQTDTKNSIRIWKTTSIFDYWYGELSDPGSTFIASLDYTINPRHHYVKIESLFMNDDEHSNVYKNSLDSVTAQELNENLLKFVENVAKTNSISKIIIDVHSNLRIYNKYYKNNGFQLTDRKCADNPYWIETEKII